jgi:nitrogenase molybdenum-iron protein NifN
VAAVTSCRATVLERIPVAQVHIGDLEDVEQLAQRNEAELLLGNSHAWRMWPSAWPCRCCAMGFPLYDQIGAYRRTWIGYRGSRQTLFDLANGLLGAHQQPVMPYHSLYSPKPDHRPEEHGHETATASMDRHGWH